MLRCSSAIHPEQAEAMRWKTQRRRRRRNRKMAKKENVKVQLIVISSSNVVDNQSFLKDKH